MHPAKPVPVRLESESLDSAKGTSTGKQEGIKGSAKESKGSVKEMEGKQEETEGSEGRTTEGAAAFEASVCSKHVPVCNRARVEGVGWQGKGRV